MSLPNTLNSLPVGAGMELQTAISRGGLIPPSQNFVGPIIAGVCALCAVAGGICEAIEGTMLISCSVCIVGMACETIAASNAAHIEYLRRKIKEFTDAIEALKKFCKEAAQLQRYGSEAICFISGGGRELEAWLADFVKELTKYLGVSTGVITGSSTASGGHRNNPQM